MVNGQYPLDFKPNVIPCCDMAGEIIAVGNEVEGWNIGDRVCAQIALDYLFGDIFEKDLDLILGSTIDGTLAEYKTFPAKSLVRVPESLSYEEASTLPGAGVTAFSAFMGPVPLKGGDTVLVQGTGGVSSFALQFAVASGATVIVTSSSDRKLEIAAKLGAKHLINYKTTPDWEEEVLKITHGRGVDHIIEVGGPGTLVKSIKCVRFCGWIHVIGYLTSGDVSSVPVSLLTKGVILRGVLGGPRTQFEAMNRLIEANDIKPVVDKVFSFEEAQAAYKHLASQQHFGKVVIKVSKD